VPAVTTDLAGMGVHCRNEFYHENPKLVSPSDVPPRSEVNLERPCFVLERDGKDDQLAAADLADYVYSAMQEFTFVLMHLN
jgi:hypothetical protein